MEANSMNQVNKIILAYFDCMIDDPFLFICASNARKRILRIQKELKKSYQNYQMN